MSKQSQDFIKKTVDDQKIWNELLKAPRYEPNQTPMVLVEAPIEADKASSINSWWWFIQAPDEVMGWITTEFNRSADRKHAKQEPKIQYNGIEKLLKTHVITH